MTTNTYDALFTQTITGSAVSSVSINLAGISGYTDLVLQCSLRTDTSTFNNMNFPSLRFNGDSTSGLYSVTNLYTRNTGGGNAAASGRSSSQNEINLGGVATSAMSSGIFSNYQIHIQNYANSSLFKTVLARIGTGGNITALDGVWASVGLWRNTNAITSISLTASSSGLFQIGSTFSLYGIRAEGITPAPKATGGAIYSDTDYYYHVFGSTGVFTPLQSLSCDYLVIAGGGAGGGANGAGGGAGGFRTSIGGSPLSVTATPYTITVGAGGTGTSTNGNNGSNSTFDTITSTGGGGGARDGNGVAGGSGGGGSYVSGTGGAASPSGQGNAGGIGGPSGDGNNFSGGGGGGAGAVGGNGGVAVGGIGGAGLSSTFAIPTGTGVSGFYAGGGGGSTGNIGIIGRGGIGGGGAGNLRDVGSPVAGSPNTGGGGGGNGTFPVAGANGGSGIVIVRYAKA